MKILSSRAVYDISVLLGEENATYPGDTPYSRDMDSTISAGAGYNLSTLKLSCHAGTHVDAPAHFIEGETSIDRYPITRFILPAQVMEVDDRDSIKPDNLKGVHIEKGGALLFKTQNSRSGLSRNKVFSESFVYLSNAAANLCINLGISLVGIDYVSVDRYGDDVAPIHHLLLKNDVLILEGINLKDVSPGRYTLIVLPLKIKGGEAAPSRAILLK